MSEVTLNLSDYKSSGVYFVEIDNSIAKGTNANAALRLAVVSMRMVLSIDQYICLLQQSVMSFLVT